MFTCRHFCPQYKLSGAFQLPWWQLSLAAVFQSLPGAPRDVTYVASNAEIIPSLGRPLAGANTATVALVEPNTFFDDRVNQVDVRLAKSVRVGLVRIQGTMDVYNIFNAEAVTNANARFGATFLVPSSVMGARMLKFGAQIDF